MDELDLPVGVRGPVLRPGLPSLPSGISALLMACMTGLFSCTSFEWQGTDCGRVDERRC